MKVKGIVEKGSDGLYSVYSDNSIGKHGFGGFGDSVSEAKEDFKNSVEEAIALAKEDGIAVPDVYSVEYSYDIPSLFGYLEYFNISKFAEFAGINESKMRAYKAGLAFPGERTTRKIAAAISRIEEQLHSVSLSTK